MGFVRRALLCTVLVLLAAAPQAGAADWRDGGLITDPDRQAQPMRPAVGGSGDSAFAWSGYVRQGSQPFVRTRPRRGTLGSETLLSSESEDILAYANAADDLLLVSGAPLASPRRVLVRSDTVRDATASPQTLVDAGPDDFICGFTAALGTGGRAVVMYGVAPPYEPAPASADYGRCSLRMRFRASRSAPFGPEVRLTDPTAASNFQAGFDSAGRAMLAWTQPPAGSASGASISAVRVDAAGLPSAAQEVAVPGEQVSGETRPLLRVAPTGRTLLAFGSRRPGANVHVAAATGDTTVGLGAADVLSGPAILAANYGSDLDAALGDDGTAAVVWRAGRQGSAKVQGAVTGPSEALTSASTDTLSRAQARGPRVAVGAGRADVAWFRLVPGVGRTLEATSGRPGAGFGHVTRISASSPVAAQPPEVVTTDKGAAWFGWLEGPAKSAGLSGFTVVRSRKLTAGSGKFSRVLDVLRARSGELIGGFEFVRSNADAVLGVVERTRPAARPSRSRAFWQLRTYGE